MELAEFFSILDAFVVKLLNSLGLSWSTGKDVLHIFEKIIFLIMNLIPEKMKTVKLENTKFCWKDYKDIIALYWQFATVIDDKIVLTKELQNIPLEMLNLHQIIAARGSQKIRTTDFCSNNFQKSIPVCLQACIVSYQGKI